MASWDSAIMVPVSLIAGTRGFKQLVVHNLRHGYRLVITTTVQRRVVEDHGTRHLKLNVLLNSHQTIQFREYGLVKIFHTTS